MKTKNKILLFAIFLFSASAFSFQKRTLVLESNVIPEIRLRPGWVTIISLPLKPTHVVKASNAIEISFRESDILVLPGQMPTRTNLVIYADGVRYTFNLNIAHSGKFDELVTIRHKEVNRFTKTSKVKIPYSDEQR